ncbi:MAG: hypothetical protein IJB45_08080 [Clostridia bacterium]|nr:hypothetical protein [Clostridia bacterium]
MKKAFSVFAAAAIFLLTAAGCEKQIIGEKTPPPLPESFSATVEAVYGELTMTAEFTQNSFDDFSIKMISPEILSPLTVNYKEGFCKIIYDGLEFEADLSRFPQTEFGHLLTQAISDIKTDIEITKTYNEGIWSYSGSSERGIFTMTRNAETGAWLELEIEGAPLHVVFSDFNIK